MNDVVSQTKSQFIRVKDRMVLLLAKTPDDRINWSPSATSRTPLQQVAHSAMAISGIHGMLLGRPFPFENIADMDTSLRADEKKLTTRDDVLSLLEKNGNEYLAWLDTLTAEQLAGTIQSPFGPMPMAGALGFATDHTRGHTAQIEYIQTVYGDLDWYMQP